MTAQEILDLLEWGARYFEQEASTPGKLASMKNWARERSERFAEAAHALRKILGAAT